MTSLARYIGGLCIAGMALMIYLAPAERPASFFIFLALLICFLGCVATVVVSSAKDKGLSD